MNWRLFMNAGYNFNGTIKILILFSFSSILAVSDSYTKELPPRGFAGFQYRDITKADQDSLNLTDTNGLYVLRVFPNTPAQNAGLLVGDIVKKYDQTSIINGAHLISTMKNYYAGDNIKITFLRDGKLKESVLVLKAFPQEVSDELDIEYTSFQTDDIFLRALITSPLNSKDKKLPAVLLVSALSSPRLIGLPTPSMTRELADTITKNGFRVMRFELRGFGDSEGEDYLSTDFETELQDNLAAFDYFSKRYDITKVFVYGHSTGGMMASLIAQKRKTSGLITSCTIGRTFYERMVETLRIQGEFAGDSAIEIDKGIKDFLFLTISIAQGESLDKIVEQSPPLARFINYNNRIMDDRTEEYWRQQLNLNVSEVYSKVTEPVLIIYGLSDYLTQLKCHEHIRDVLIDAGNKDVQLKTFPNLDHGYCYAKDKKTSYQNYQSRSFEYNPVATEAITQWLKKHIN